MKYLLLCLLFSSCNLLTKINQPKFKVGDCIVDVNDLEFKEYYKPHYRKIIKVGNKMYLYKHFSVIDEYRIETIDRYYRKVDNSFCKDM